MSGGVAAPAPRRRGGALLPLVLIAVTLIAYWPALRNDFVYWDDQLYVMENPLLGDPDGVWKGWTTFRETERQYYPLLLTTYWIEHRLWGDNPAGYHAVNIWFHAANSLLVLLLLSALGAGWWAAGVSALLFSLHPIQVESVAWIAELKNLQMGFFYLAAFLCYLAHRSSVPPLATGSGPFVRGWAAYGAALFLYACALLSKTAAITLPLSLLLADWLLVAPRDRSWWRGSAMRVAPMLVMGIAPALMTISLEEGPAPSVIPPVELRPFVAATALWFYLGKLIAPFPLIPIYPRWELSDMRFWLLLAMVALGGVLLLLWRCRRQVPPLAAWGMGHFIVTLSPVLGFVPFGYLDHSFVADHFVYLASIGLFAAAAVGLERIARGLIRRGVRSGWWLVTGFVCLVLAGGFGLVRAQLPVWRDPMVFWTYLSVHNPGSSNVHINLGNAYLRQQQLSEASDHYRRALALQPTYSLAHKNLGLVLSLQGHLEEAVAEYRRALDSQPDDWQAHANLAVALAEQGRISDAIREVESARLLALARGRTDAVAKLEGLLMAYRERR